jgi:hypothetical protein
MAGQHEHLLYLVTAMLTVKAPLAEMFTVVAEQAITVLADPWTRSTDHLRVIEANGFMGPHPDSVSVHEALERDFFYRSSRQVMWEAAVMNDIAAADVDAMMSKAKTRCDEVCAQRRLFVPRQESVLARHPSYLPRHKAAANDPRETFVREHTLILELAAGNAAPL